MNTSESSSQTSSTETAAPARTRSTSGRIVAITTAAIGAVVLLGVGSTAALATAGTVWSVSAGGSDSQTSDASGLTGIDVDASAADLTIEFDDVDEARLETRGNNWRLERSGTELIVERERWAFGNWCFGPCDAGARGASVLTLPRELNGMLDAHIRVGAGSVSVDGDFDDLTVSVGAGEAELRGSANTLRATVDTGTARIALRDVDEADIQVSVGEASVTLTGAAPSRVGVNVSVGDATITLPDESYNVSQSASVGAVDNRLRTDPRSPHIVQADVSVGSITLQS